MHACASLLCESKKECSRCLLKDEYAYRKVIIMKGSDFDKLIYQESVKNFDMLKRTVIRFQAGFLA